VPDPMTTTSYSFAIYPSFFLIVESGTKDTVAGAAGETESASVDAASAGSRRDTWERSRV
jgi:hypothetical protein